MNRKVCGTMGSTKNQTTTKLMFWFENTFWKEESVIGKFLEDSVTVSMKNFDDWVVVSNGRSHDHLLRKYNLEKLTKKQKQKEYNLFSLKKHHSFYVKIINFVSGHFILQKGHKKALEGLFSISIKAKLLWFNTVSRKSF